MRKIEQSGHEGVTKRGIGRVKSGGKGESRKDGGEGKTGSEVVASPHTKLCALSLVQAAAYLRARSPSTCCLKLRSSWKQGVPQGTAVDAAASTVRQGRERETRQIRGHHTFG